MKLMHTKPRGGSSLLALTASIKKHYGLEITRPSHPEVDRLLAKNPRNVVFVLFDGMGTALLDAHAEDVPFMRSRFAGSMATVFPPTTTAATTAAETGLSPIEHGWLGWSLYFRELDKVVNLYPNTSERKPAAKYHVARTVMPFETIVQSINRSELGVDAHCVSPYGDVRVGSIEELLTRLGELCSEPGRHYLYGYSPLPDYDMHDLGTMHPTISAHLRLIDSGLKALAESLDDTLILVSADHGMLDTDWRFMSEHPELCEMLESPPSIEARAMSFFVKEGRKDDFARRFNELYGDIYELIPHNEVMRRGLFGDGEPHPRAEGFVGDFIAVATGRTSIGYELDPEPFKAVHAGGTDIESTIPLIAIDTVAG